MSSSVTQASEAVQIPAVGRYTIDSPSSTVSFRARHLFGLGRVRGTFTIAGGTVEVRDPLDESGVQVRIDASSFHTGSRARDGDVRSSRFLDAQQFPVLTFTADRLTRSAGGATLLGTLTVRDVSRRVEVAIDTCTVEAGAFLIRASTRIDRVDFGLTAKRGLAGRHLQVTLEVRCARR